MVSIIIPSYQRPSCVVEAVESCLRQTYQDIEIIVVDDNDPGTEYRSRTEKEMQRYADNPKVMYVRHERNKKGAAARNTGIRAAHGGYLTFLDDDDILLPRKIEAQVACLEELPGEYGVACCAVEVRDERTDRLMKVVKPAAEGDAQFEALRLRIGIGSGSNPMFRREAVEETGMFDERFLRHQDTEYLVRILRSYKMAAVPDVLLVKYQSHHPNRPDFKKYQEVNELFLRTFKKDIDGYSKEQQREIYRNHLHQLCIVAVDARQWREAWRYYRLAARSMKYTMRMKLGIVRHVFNNKY